MKIVSTGTTLSTPEYFEKKKQARNRKFIVFSSVFVLLLAAAVLISRVESLLIKDVSIEGARVVTSEKIADSVKNTLASKYLWLVPKSNFAIYPRNEVKEELMKDFPRINFVALSTEGFERLVVAVVEREPYALYCPTEILSQDALACYFLDDTGFIFDKAPAFSGLVYMIFTSEVPIEEPLGARLLPVQEFASLKEFLSRLPSLGLKPVSLEIKERDYEAVNSTGSKLIWKRDNDAKLVLSNLEAFLKSDAIKTEENFLKKLSSLDLRTPNKVFYKFKE